MKKHGLTEEDLRRASAEKDMKSTIFDDKNKVLHPSSRLCGMVIAEFCEVTFWEHRFADYDGKVERTEGNFFGFHQDVEMAHFLMTLVRESMDRSWRDFLGSSSYNKRVSKHKQYWGFYRGFGARINNRLKELISARTIVSPGSGTDLVVLKQALVEQGRSVMYPNLVFEKFHLGKIDVDARSYLEGMVQGDKVNLNRPIKSEKRGSLLK